MREFRHLQYIDVPKLLEKYNHKDEQIKKLVENQKHFDELLGHLDHRNQLEKIHLKRGVSHEVEIKKILKSKLDTMEDQYKGFVMSNDDPVVIWKNKCIELAEQVKALQSELSQFREKRFDPFARETKASKIVDTTSSGKFYTTASSQNRAGLISTKGNQRGSSVKTNTSMTLNTTIGPDSRNSFASPNWREQSPPVSKIPASYPDRTPPNMLKYNPGRKIKGYDLDASVKTLVAKKESPSPKVNLNTSLRERSNERVITTPF